MTPEIADSSARQNAPKLSGVATSKKRAMRPARRRRIEQRWRLRAGDAAEHVEHRLQLGIVEHRFGDDQLARSTRKMSAGSRSARGLGDPESAGRDVDPGQREGVFRRAFTRPSAIRKLDSAGASSLSSVMVPGVTSRTTSRLHHRLAAALPASAGSSICSQTATRKPAPISFCR